MDVRESLTLNKPEEFRRWLQKNHRTKIEIWLIFYKKSSGKQTLTIVQAVEEALCFGWIQSRLKPLELGTIRGAVSRLATREASGRRPISSASAS